MSLGEERRDEWQCCRILGDGPEHCPWTRILGVHPIQAWEAAETYASERMPDEDYGDGDHMHVAVQTKSGHALVYKVYKNYQVDYDSRPAGEREDLAP